MDNIKAFLEADAKRTQGEWTSTRCFVRGEAFAIYDEGGHTEEDANFIAAASRIAPEIRNLLAAFEQVCEALEQIRDNTQDNITEVMAHQTLIAASPYRKGGV